MKGFWDQNVDLDSLPEVPEEEVVDQIKKVPKHYSAYLIGDISFDAWHRPVSIAAPPLLSGGSVCPGSGTIIGATCNLGNANTLCNLYAMGVTLSGQLRLQVQTSDSDTSGNFTDPTSGLPVFPGAFQSGGILWINSGGAGGGILGAQMSGESVLSGFSVAAAFQRPGTFARINVLSEGTAQFAGPLVAGFISNLRTIGSGFGTTQSPGSGTPSV